MGTFSFTGVAPALSLQSPNRGFTPIEGLMLPLWMPGACRVAWARLWCPRTEATSLSMQMASRLAGPAIGWKRKNRVPLAIAKASALFGISQLPFPGPRRVIAGTGRTLDDVPFRGGTQTCHRPIQFGKRMPVLGKFARPQIFEWTSRTVSASILAGRTKSWRTSGMRVGQGGHKS